MVARGCQNVDVGCRARVPARFLRFRVGAVPTHTAGVEGSLDNRRCLIEWGGGHKTRVAVFIRCAVWLIAGVQR